LQQADPGQFLEISQVVSILSLSLPFDRLLILISRAVVNRFPDVF